MSSWAAYLTGLFDGYRLPNVSKLWRHDVSAVDGRLSVPNEPLMTKLESFFIRVQEISLWTDPKSSLSAVALLHLFFLYLRYTASTVLNLTCWAVILGLVYTTWVNKIWPEIRVAEEDPVGPTPLSPGVYSGPELAEITQRAQSK